MHRMVRYSVFAYLLLLLFVVFHVYAQDPAPVYTVVTPDGTVRKGINRVLSLDGDGDYVEMADNEILNDIGSQVTVEAWIRATAFSDQWIPIIHKADESGSPDWRNRSYVLTLNNSGFIELASAPVGQGHFTLNSPVGLIALNTWYHVAGIVDAKNGVMRVFVNGTEVARGDSGKNIHVSKLPLQIGWRHGADRFPFEGWIDEVRIWNVARTQEEIRAKMHTTLSGSEPGLVGYWQFDDRADMVTDSSPNQIHGRLMGDAHIVEAELPRPDELDIPTVISGTVRDELGGPVGNVIVRLVQGDVEIAQEMTDALGQYRIVIPRLTGELYDLSATSGTRGQMLLDMSLHKGESRSFDLALREAISIQGTLMMLDNATPHVAVPVQAIRNGKVIATALSNEGGRYQLVNLKPGRYQVRCYTLDGYVYYLEGKDKTQDISQATYLNTQCGNTLRNIDFRFAPFKKGIWRNYDTLDGLGSDFGSCIYQDPDGVMWFGMWVGGLCRYDGERYVSFTADDGLASNTVACIYRDSHGVMWFGTSNGASRYDGEAFVSLPYNQISGITWVNNICGDPNGAIWFATRGEGVSRYDGKTFTTLTTGNGLGSSLVYAIYCDSDGIMWFGTGGGGVSRYDGKGFVNFTKAHGLASNVVLAIHSGQNGIMWFGTDGGVSRYDGNKFTNLTKEDGLLNNLVWEIHSDPDGIMWFATDGGVSRYDGKGFVNYTSDDGLADNSVHDIYRDPDGALWFATGRQSLEGGRGGLSRYEEGVFTDFTTKDGLSSNNVQTTYVEADGILWVGTWGGGVARYDGKGFINLTSDDGLASNNVHDVYRDPDGTMWLATDGGVSHYDGGHFVNLTKEHGLAGNYVRDIHRDQYGVMWFAIRDGGLSKYGGDGFVNFTIEHGLLRNNVRSVLEGPDGAMWIGGDRWIGWERGQLNSAGYRWLSVVWNRRRLNALLPE